MGDKLKSTPQTDNIRKVASELFALNGYNGVGVAELGNAVGLGRGALYHHIGSKEDLLYDIASRYIIHMIEEAKSIVADTPDPEECINKLSESLMVTISKNLSDMTVCFREINSLSEPRHKIVSSYHLEYQRIWEAVFERGEKEKVFREVTRLECKAFLGMYFYSFLWLRRDGKQSAHKLGRIYANIVLSAVKA